MIVQAETNNSFKILGGGVEILTLTATSNQTNLDAVFTTVAFQKTTTNTARLTKTGNAVKIGKNIKKVLVNTNIWAHNVGGYAFVRVFKNSEIVAQAIANHDQHSFRNISITSFIVEVIENDLISVQIEMLGGADKSVVGAQYGGSTYLTVQIIE